MARQLLLFQHSSHSTNPFQVGMAGMTLFLCAMALFMCASHSRKWRQWKACYEPDTDDPIVPHIQHGNGEPNVDVDEQEVSVWQKNILMGGKCQLPDFSGVIIYDSNGSIVPPTKSPRLLLPWK
ncbi:nucleolar protein [Trema orientale]|uniref:Nucleolar protein n=1 Tax=Trema orientale TaxID=63057 RepID=A0A2P5FEU2_TREOI|nr:nucleolar protein [Trema orientale]